LLQIYTSRKRRRKIGGFGFFLALRERWWWWGKWCDKVKNTNTTNQRGNKHKSKEKKRVSFVGGCDWRVIGGDGLLSPRSFGEEKKKKAEAEKTNKQMSGPMMGRLLC